MLLMTAALIIMGKSRRFITTPNRYSYSVNDPINSFGPLGLLTACVTPYWGAVWSDGHVEIWYGHPVCWNDFSVKSPYFTSAVDPGTFCQGSNLPPRQECRNSSVRPSKSSWFSGRAKPWPSSGYTTKVTWPPFLRMVSTIFSACESFTRGSF